MGTDGPHDFAHQEEPPGGARSDHYLSIPHARTITSRCSPIYNSLISWAAKGSAQPVCRTGAQLYEIPQRFTSVLSRLAETARKRRGLERRLRFFATSDSAFGRPFAGPREIGRAAWTELWLVSDGRASRALRTWRTERRLNVTTRPARSSLVYESSF